METIKEAKAYVREHWTDKDGAECPCCGLLVKVYKRFINSIMARGLISIYHLGEGYHHVSDIMSAISPSGSSDFSKLRYYGFIEQKINDKTSKHTSGLWKIKEAGVDFVLNKTSYQKYFYVFNKKCLKFEGEYVSIVDGLGENFHYQELMNATKNESV